MYLGEIVRNILVSLVDAAPKSLLFKGKATQALNTHYGLDTSVMSDVEMAWEKDAYVPGAVHCPQLGAYEAENLDDEVKTKLERVRQVIIEQLGYEEGDVSLQDAAVGCFNLPFIHWLITFL